MTAGQWEQYAAEVAERLAGDPSRVGEWKTRALAVLAVAGPRIAEDTRDRLVAAAGVAVERGPMVDAGRLAAWLRHEMAGAASQREVDAYDRVLRMVEKGGEPEGTQSVEAACKATAECIVSEIERCSKVLVTEADESGSDLVAAVLKKDIARVAGGLT